jgi:hypothetical protein
MGILRFVGAHALPLALLGTCIGLPPELIGQTTLPYKRHFYV